MEKAWWKKSVIYQIYPRSFADSNGDGIGDINGITAHLDYLKDLGVDVIWLSPVYQSPNDDNGYDISDYQAIMQEFGTMEDFDRMLEEMHKRGLKLVMDLVVNHTSDEHRWYYLHCFSKKQPDLNWENEKVRKEVFDMMTWWCEKGVDGFRMDVISMISKDPAYPDGIVHNGLYGDNSPYVCNGPRVHEYLQEMNQKVLSKFDLITVGEAAGVTVEEAKKYANLDGSELNMVFQFEHVDAPTAEHGKWTDKRFELKRLRSILNKWQTQLEGKAWNSLYWDNHDQPRAVSRFGNDGPMYRELSAKMLATCLHMLKGTPYIYQGEEIGMTNAYFDKMEDYRDIESINTYKEFTENGLMNPEEMMSALKAVSRDNARTPMQWNTSAHAGFTTGEPWIRVNPNYLQINAEAAVEDKNSIYYYYQKLIKLRKNYEIIIDGIFEGLLEEDENIYAYARNLGSQRLVVACNFSGEEVSCDLFDRAEEGKELISNYEYHKDGMLKPYEARAILFEK